MNWLVATTEVACVGLSYACFRGYGRLVSGWSDAAGWLRRGLSVGLPGVAVVTAILLDRAGLRRWMETLLPGVVGTAVGLTALAVGVYLAVMAGYRATVPTDAAIRGTDVDAGATTREFAVFAAGVVGVVDAVAVALAVGPWWVPAAAVVALAVGFFVFGGALAARVGTARPPTTTERARVVDALDRYTATTGRSVDDIDIEILDTDDSRWAGAFVRGPPWRRSVFVASHLLETHTEDGIAAVLAVAVGRAERGYFAWKTLTTAILGVGILSAVAFWTMTPVLSLLLAVVTAVAYLAGCWWARRCVFAADADALAVTDPQTVVETHQRIAADADTTLHAGTGIRNFLRGRASRARRIAAIPNTDPS